MRSTARILCLLFLATLGTTAQESGTGTIEGVALVAGNRTPVPQARVVLRTWISSQPARETVTNKSGAFAFDRVPASPLPYIVTVEREGYRQQIVSFRTEGASSPVGGDGLDSTADGGSLTVEVKSGMRVTAEFQLTTAGVIAGHISDPEGRLAPNVSVELIKVNGNSIVYSPLPNKRVSTDSEGKYRFDDVLPGEYFVEASLARFGPRYTNDGASSNVWMPDPLTATYYPGVSNRRQAGWVTVPPAAVFPAIDFLLARPSPWRITGRIVNPLNFDLDSDSTLAGYSRPRNGVGRNPEGFGIDKATSYSFYLASKDQAAGESSVIGPLPNYADAPYRFELRHVPPGNYDLYVVFLPDTGDRYKWHAYAGRSVVSVKSSDVTSADVQIERNAEITGQVVRHSSVPERARSRSGGKPTLTSADPMPGTLSIDPRLQMLDFVETNGAFQIPGGVPPGRYRVGMMRYTLPAGVYVDAARLNGANILGVPFTIDGGSKNELVLELRGDGGQLQGTVVDKDRRKVANAGVVLAPPDQGRDDFSAYWFGTTNDRGEFTIEGIRPGSYSALAFSRPVQMDVFQSPSFIAPHLGGARRVEVDKGKKTRTDLNPIILP